MLQVGLLTSNNYQIIMDFIFVEYSGFRITKNNCYFISILVDFDF